MLANANGQHPAHQIDTQRGEDYRQNALQAVRKNGSIGKVRFDNALQIVLLLLCFDPRLLERGVRYGQKLRGKLLLDKQVFVFGKSGGEAVAGAHCATGLRIDLLPGRRDALPNCGDRRVIGSRALLLRELRSQGGLLRN